MFGFTVNIEKIDEHSRGVAREYFGDLSYDVTWLVIYCSL